MNIKAGAWKALSKEQRDYLIKAVSVYQRLKRGMKGVTNDGFSTITTR